MTRLRMVTPADFAALERQHESPEVAGEMSWYGYRQLGYLQRRYDNNEIVTADRGMLVVVDDDDVVLGDVSWIRVSHGPPPSGDAWNVGIWLLPEHRGKGHGSVAQRMVAAYLFDVTKAERVEASTEFDNIAEQRALEKAGFTREGVLRHACFRGGRWRDMVMYSKLRGEE